MAAILHSAGVVAPHQPDRAEVEHRVSAPGEGAAQSLSREALRIVSDDDGAREDIDRRAVVTGQSVQDRIDPDGSPDASVHPRDRQIDLVIDLRQRLGPPFRPLESDERARGHQGDRAEDPGEARAGSACGSCAWGVHAAPKRAGPRSIRSESRASRPASGGPLPGPARRRGASPRPAVSLRWPDTSPQRRSPHTPASPNRSRPSASLLDRPVRWLRPRQRLDVVRFRIGIVLELVQRLHRIRFDARRFGIVL